MVVQSIFSSYSRLSAGICLASIAIALAGCDSTVAEKAAPSRPVLVASVHYEPESPQRSFVGTIRPRIEADMGFRVPGKVAKRLVEVGQTVEVGQPLAMLDEIDLKLQAEQAVAEFNAATGVLAQAAAAETRAKAERIDPEIRQVREVDRVGQQQVVGQRVGRRGIPDALLHCPELAGPSRRHGCSPA